MSNTHPHHGQKHRGDVGVVSFGSPTRASSGKRSLGPRRLPLCHLSRPVTLDELHHFLASLYQVPGKICAALDGGCSLTL